jgi:hypothetical protein
VTTAGALATLQIQVATTDFQGARVDVAAPLTPPSWRSEFVEKDHFT